MPMAGFLQLAEAAGMSVVDRDEVVAAEEKVDVVGGEPVLLYLEVYAVQDQVEVTLVRLDLGMVNLAERVFDGQRMKLEGLGENRAPLVRRRRPQVHPHQHGRGGVEPS